MDCISTIDGSPDDVAAQTRGLVWFVVAQNRLLMRRSPIPPLYESGVVFRPEPWASKVQHFCHCGIVLARKWGDCKQLVAWRVAELLEQGVACWPRTFWRYANTRDLTRDLHDGLRMNAERFVLHHVQVEFESGAIEDPSEVLYY